MAGCRRGGIWNFAHVVIDGGGGDDGLGLFVSQEVKIKKPSGDHHDSRTA
jgi:hypothetical protein